MATSDSESNSKTTEPKPTPTAHELLIGETRPRSSSYPWRAQPLDIPRQRERSKTIRPSSGIVYTSSPDKCYRARKRSNSDDIPPRLPLENKGIQLGSAMAKEAAKSFWNKDMLYGSLQKLKEYAEQTKMIQDSDEDGDNDETRLETVLSVGSNMEQLASEHVDEFVNSSTSVEESFTMDEDNCASTSEDLLGVSDTTSEDLLGVSDTAIAISKGTDSLSTLSSSLKLQSVLSTLHSLSDHQLQLKTHKHIFYPLGPMKRAHTDPCLSPRSMRAQRVPQFAKTLEVFH